MAVIIEGVMFFANKFAYDGCHKIYLLNSWKHDEEDEAIEAGYEIFDIEELEETYGSSCPMRFIDTWDLAAAPVGQCFEEREGRLPEIEIIH